jgi:hypothetical protein
MDFPGRVIKVGEADPAIVTAVAQKLVMLGYHPSSTPHSNLWSVYFSRNMLIRFIVP